MAVVQCLECGAATEPEQTGDYCRQCNKLLPASARGTNITALPSPAGSPQPTGADLNRVVWVSPEEQAARKFAFHALLIVALSYLVCGVGSVLMLSGDVAVGPERSAFVIASVVMLALFVLVFVALAWRARSRPLHATLTGLAVYLLLLCIDFLSEPASLTRGIAIKSILILILGQAVRGSWSAHKLAAKVATR
jgi:hypothetical protein